MKTSSRAVAAAPSLSLIDTLEPRQLFTALPNGFVTPTNLVANRAGLAINVDASLVNPWGIAQGPGDDFWISDNGTGVTTLYNGLGNKNALVVTIPGAGGAPSTVTGQVYNPGSGFVVHEGALSGASPFVFVGEDGIISGWSPAVALTHAVMAIDNSGANAVYKGSTLATTPTGSTELFVANFHSAKVEVYSDTFATVPLGATAFSDRKLPRGYAPFNVQEVAGNIYVTYAKQDATLHEEASGAGHGYVDVFNPDGKLLHRLQHGKFMNSPWGVTLAPSTWGKLAGNILVGQFGSGQIIRFNAKGTALGALTTQDKKPIAIDGLWAITPGTATTQSVYYTAGPYGEQDGLFGKLDFTPIAKHK